MSILVQEFGKIQTKPDKFNKSNSKQNNYNQTQSIDLQKQIISFQGAQALKAVALAPAFGNKSDTSWDDIHVPYIKGSKPVPVIPYDIPVVMAVPRKYGDKTIYDLEKQGKILGKITVDKDCKIKTRIGETKASDGKSGLTVTAEFGNGLYGVIPKEGYLKANGLEVDLRDEQNKKKTGFAGNSPAFAGNFVVTTGYRPEIANILIPQYFDKKLYEKIKDRPKELTHDVDIIELTAGVGSRTAPLTRISETNKPGLQLPYSNGYLMYNPIDNAFRSGLIDENTEPLMLHDKNISGNAMHVVLAKRAGMISGDKPVLVCSSDHVHDIDFNKAIQAFKDKTLDAETKGKPKPLAMLISMPVSNYEGLGIINANEDGVIKNFIEKPKRDEDAKDGLIKGTNKYRANTGIYILSPEFVTALCDMEKGLKRKDKGVLDFGNDIFPVYKQLGEGSDDKSIQFRNKYNNGNKMALYVYEADEKSHWSDFGGCVQDTIDNSVDMARGLYKLPRGAKTQVKSNVDIKNKVVFTPEAKAKFDELERSNEYGKITASNVIFLTEDKNITENKKTLGK